SQSELRYKAPDNPPPPKAVLGTPELTCISEKKLAGSSDRSVCPSIGLLIGIPSQRTWICSAERPRCDAVAKPPGPFPLINRDDSALSTSATDKDGSRLNRDESISSIWVGW